MDIGGALQHWRRVEDTAPARARTPTTDSWVRRQGLHLAYASGNQHTPQRAIDAMQRATIAVRSSDDRSAPLVARVKARHIVAQECTCSAFTVARQRVAQQRSALAAMRSVSAPDRDEFAPVVPLPPRRPMARRSRSYMATAAASAAIVLGPLTLAAAQMAPTTLAATDTAAAVQAVSQQVEDIIPVGGTAPAGGGQVSLCSNGGAIGGYCLVTPGQARESAAVHAAGVDEPSRATSRDGDDDTSGDDPAPEPRLSSAGGDQDGSSGTDPARRAKASHPGGALRDRPVATTDARREVGRPDHPRTTGRPGPAERVGKADNEKTRPAVPVGNGGDRKDTGRPDHSYTTGRPGHAGGHGSHDERPGRGSQDDDRRGNQGSKGNQGGNDDRDVRPGRGEDQGAQPGRGNPGKGNQGGAPGNNQGGNDDRGGKPGRGDDRDVRPGRGNKGNGRNGDAMTSSDADPSIKVELARPMAATTTLIAYGPDAGSPDTAAIEVDLAAPLVDHVSVGPVQMPARDAKAVVEAALNTPDSADDAAAELLP